MGHDFDEIVMKLAKKNDQAVMSFEIFGTTRTGKRVRVGHDVKVCMVPVSAVRSELLHCVDRDPETE